MTQWTYENLGAARERVQSLLEDLHLDAYLFGVEPRDGRWEVRVEYAISLGWRTAILAVEESALAQSATNTRVRRNLLNAWREALSGAKLAPLERTRANRAGAGNGAHHFGPARR
ncbi:MAG: hypothetical protein HOW73_12090 [Polyangiaceae bacterium]|nr:hypothetical protein [Polyangiaceae bacterium]